MVEPSSSGEQLDEEGGEEDHQEVLLEDHRGVQRQTRPARQVRRQRIRTESPEVMSKELSEFIAEEMNQMAEDSGESGITDMESETTISIRSAPLPQSIDSSEELSKLRPRIDPRLCPSPG